MFIAYNTTSFSRIVFCAIGTVWIIISLTGCAILGGRALRQGYDETEALGAIGILAEKHTYLDFNQIFPDTYRFDLPKKEVYDIIVRQLTASGEDILEMDAEKGFIYTAAKEAPLPHTDDKTDDQERIYYQLSIFLTQKSKDVTYVTNYPTVLKGDYMELLIPFARNMLRGIFFGSLAAEIYPDLKKKGLFVAQKKSGEGVIAENTEKSSPGMAKGSDSDTGEIAHDAQRGDSLGDSAPSEQGEVVHVVQLGDTLGKIALKYTGKVKNYKRIADYNSITNPKNIAVGQKIIIPADMLK